MLSKRLRSKLLTPSIQIALSQQGPRITCKLYYLPSALSLDFDYMYTKWATLANEGKVMLSRISLGTLYAISICDGRSPN